MRNIALKRGLKNIVAILDGNSPVIGKKLGKIKRNTIFFSKNGKNWKNSLNNLLIASRTDDEEILIKLIQNGADLELKDETGQHLLHWAAENGLNLYLLLWGNHRENFPHFLKTKINLFVI